MTIVDRSTALLLLIAGSLMSQGRIDTIALWDRSLSNEPFGTGASTATYGQTINVPADSGPLVSFGFEIGHCTVSFRGEVYAWDGTNSRAILPKLFESAVTSVSSPNQFQLVTFYTGGLTLAAGDYVLFVSTSRNQDAPAAACQWGALADTAYLGGTFVSLNNLADTSQWTSTAWGTNGSDLAFQVNVAAAPAPAPAPAGVPADSPTTLLLGFAGVIALGLLGLSRFRIAR